MTPTPKPQGFSDEDLAMLKEWNTTLPQPIIVGLEQGDEFHEFELSALLARLEASERKNIANDAYADFDCPHDAEHQCRCGLIQMKLFQECQEAHQAWRRSKGL